MRRLYALRRFIMTWLFALMMVGAFATAHAATATAPSLVVKMADGLTADQQAAVVARNGGVETAAIPVLRMHVISIPTGDPAVVLQNYQSDAQVERAELNKTRKSEGLPSDTHYSVQWALSKIGWDSVFGSIVPAGSAKVAILDTGIDASHPDLHANVIDGTSMLDNSAGSSDANGHGTSLAGIVAAVTNNDLGIAGLGFSGVQIVPVTVLNASGIGQDSDIIAGVIWAADHGADVILMGFSNADFSQNLQDAVDYAWAKGAVLVAATGNDGLSTPTFPAGARGVVGVSATNESDALAFGSNYGQDTFLAAPGTNVYTTVPGGSYSYITGTSASSAMVAGAAALIKAVDPALSNGVIVGRLAKSAAAVGTAGDPANQSYFGNGRLDLAAAVASTSTDSVQPAGAAPVGSGGPYVGPYLAAGNTGVYGTVTTLVNGQRVGINQATVTCTAGCNGTFTATTGANGSYTFATDPTFKSSNASVTFTATASGYVNSDVTVTLKNGKTDSAVDFVMVPQPKSSASVALTNLSQSYDGSPKPVTATTNPADLKVDITYNGSTTAPTDAGSYAVVATINDTKYAGSATGTLTVTKAPATVTLSGLSQTYDGSARTVTATTNVPVKTVNVTYNAATAAPTAAGSYTIVATIDDPNYQGSATGTLTVAKATATVTLAGLNQTYDGSARTVTATTDVPVKTVNVTYNAATVAPTGAGSYAIVATIDDPNYQGSATGTLTVAKATATVTLAGLSQTYDGSARTVTATTNVPVKTVNVTYNAATAAPTGAGSYTIVATIDDPNYEGSATGTLTVTKATATVTLGGLSQSYDGSARTVTATANAPVKAVTVTYNGATSAPTGAGNYAIVATVDDTNYQGSATGTLSVAKAAAAVTLVDLNQTYDGSPRTVTATTNVPVQGVTITYNGAAAIPTAANKYAIVATVNDPNYEGSATGTLLVAKATATITLLGLTQTYDGSAKIVSASTSPAGMAVDVLYDGLPTAPTGAGTHAISATINDSNYQGYATGTLTVAKARATVTLAPLTQTYDGSARTVTATTEPAGKAVSITYDGAGSAPINAGSYAIVAAIEDSNYEGSATATLTVGKARATVTLNALSQTYNGSARSVTATTEPAVQAVAITYDGAGTAPTNVGNYAVVATVNDTNYEGSATGTLTIARAAATVFLTGLDQTYNGAPRTVTATTEPPGAAVSITYGGASTAPTNAGSYAIVATVNDANYQGSASGTLTVAKAAASVNLTNLSQTYNGSPRTVTATTNPSGKKVDFTYNGLTSVPTNAGSYAVVATINDTNFEGSTSGTLDVAKAAASVALSGLNQTYDGSPKTVTATTSPAGKKVDITYNDSTSAPSALGSYTVVATINDINYQGSISGTLKIAKSAATVTLSGLSQPYDGSPKTVTVTTNPAGLKVDITYNGATTAPSNTGSYSVVATVSDPNYQGSASGTLNILTPLPAPASISVPASNSTGTITVSWQGTGYSGLSYVVDYSTDGGRTWKQAYSGIYNYTSMSVANGTYSFRVKETKSGYADSPYKVSTTNCVVLWACDPPTYVSAPTSSNTGSVTVSWGGGNVSGLTYSLEYSIAGSNNWVAAYTGIYNYASLNLPKGSYQFRVRSAKEGYVTSSYAVSGTCDVSLVCGAPTTVSAPSTSTRSVPVSWTGGTVSGATYKLQYKIEGGSWTDAYSGIYNNTIVTVPTSGSYTFQVKATKTGYDDSGWTPSAPCAVSP